MSANTIEINQSDTHTTLGPAAQPESHTYSSLQPPHVTYRSPSEEGAYAAGTTYKTLTQTADDYYNMRTYATCAFHTPTDDTQDYENSNIYLNNN